jgi:penicillin-binding protein 2
MSVVKYTFNKKLMGLALGMLGAFIAIGVQLFMLQVHLNDSFFELSQRNFLRTEYTTSPRGNILDCHGTLLATNRPVTDIYWQGTGNRILHETQVSALDKIGDITQKILPANSFIGQAERVGKKQLLVADVTFEQLSKIIELFPDNPNIHIASHFKRFYPYKNVASHILGYINNMALETCGQMGLEKLFEEELQSQQGEVLKIINSLGTSLSQQEIKKTIAGQNILTTLDLDLQLLAEASFPEGSSGALIILNPKDGSIKALLSRPSFDPTVFLEPILPEQWHILQKGRPFLNRAFNACYPPASIFKLITISAALEHNIISLEETTYCPGFMRFKGRPYFCSKRDGHGHLTVLESLAKSCNILFFKIAKKLSIDVLAQYAQKCGLGEKTGIIFNEHTGLVPNKKWKLLSKGEPWWPGETLSAAIGQSYLLATPLQVSCFISAIFEGYLVKPRILEVEAVSKRPLCLQPSTIAFLKEGMRDAGLHGTAVSVGKIKDIEIYAKTGTAQISALEKKQLGPEYLEHAWFVAYFSYKEYEPLTLVILIEHAGASKPATDVARRFILAYKKLMDTVHH